MCGISYHFFEHKVSRNSIEIAAAPADSHGGDHTAQFVAASQGGRRSIASAFLFIAALEHAILHWSVRKQPQRIEFEIKCSLLFVKHTKVLSTAIKYHQTKWRVHTPYPIITVQK